MPDLFPDWMKLPEAGRSSKKRANSRRRRKKSLNVSFSKRLTGSFDGVSAHVLVASLAVALALCVGLWFGIKSMGGMLFSDNPMFTIQTLELNSSDRVARDYIRGKLRIDHGANLFGVNIAKARLEFLRFAPHYRAMEITRILPSTMRITLVEREPIARFGRNATYVVDEHGYIFRPRGRRADLPAVHGHGGETVQPGERLSGLAADAVALIDYCRQAEFDLDIAIADIDVTGGFGGRGDSLRLQLKDQTRVDFWWSRSHGDAVTQDLHDRLAFLRTLIRTERSAGRALSSVNLTLDAYRRNLPISYRD